MKPELIWDLPTRLSHWLLAAGCCTAFALALASPEQSRAFSVHMLCGALLLPIVIFRVMWGFAGSRYARFRSFLYTPKEAFDYLCSTLTGTAERYTGHNPAASYAIIMMLLLVIGSVLSGLLIPGSKIFEEMHELVSYALLGVITVHLVGVVVHTVVHRENTAFSMLSGRKVTTASTRGIHSSHPIIGMMLLIMTGTSAVVVVNNYDFTANVFKVPLVGSIIPMGKTE
ncbi:MAG TPA: cytochrome B [Desulfuromonadales bacterium]|nr:cytochrome B [Desulfuromonadales bacterium]